MGVLSVLEGDVEYEGVEFLCVIRSVILNQFCLGALTYMAGLLVGFIYLILLNDTNSFWVKSSKFLFVLLLQCSIPSLT